MVLRDGDAMNTSLLYMDEPEYEDISSSSFLADLKISDVIEDIAAARNRQFIRELFMQKPRKLTDVLFRLAIFRDLENPQIKSAFEQFEQRYIRFQRCREYSKTLGQAQVRRK